MYIEEILKIDFGGDISRAMPDLYNLGFEQGRYDRFLNFAPMRSVLKENGYSFKETQIILKEIISGFVNGRAYEGP